MNSPENIPVRKLGSDTNNTVSTHNFYIRDIRNMLQGKDMVQPLHRHDYFFILLLEAGSGKHSIDFIPYSVVNGSVFMMRPGQVHELQLFAGASGYLLEFSRDLMSHQDGFPNRFLRRVGGRNFCTPRPEIFRELAVLLQQVYKEYTQQEEGYMEVIRAQMQVFLITLARQRRCDFTPTDEDFYSEDRLEEFMELIDLYMAQHLEVNEYAARLNISSYQLNAITKATLGKTALQVINEQMVLGAKRYLLATTRQVKDIAWELGFEDPSYFIRFFRKHTGLAPEAFRKHSK